MSMQYTTNTDQKDRHCKYLYDVVRQQLSAWESLQEKRSRTIFALTKQNNNNNNMTDHRHRKHFRVGLTLPISTQHRRHMAFDIIENTLYDLTDI